MTRVNAIDTVQGIRSPNDLEVIGFPPGDGLSSLALACLAQRRAGLSQRFPNPVVLWAGTPPSRNFPANTYPFRASSHFLYFAGRPLPGAALVLESGEATLFMDEPGPGAALWHGPTPSPAAQAEAIGAQAVYPLAELPQRAVDAVALPADLTQATAQEIALVQAIVDLRLSHDDWALAEMRFAAQVSVQAHRAGMMATRPATTEAEVRAAIEQVMMAHQCPCAYTSIVTTHGEVLHNDQYHHPLQPGDLLLVDAGAETPQGWSADITRTWPVSGQFLPPQREVYDVVLAAHDACIAAAKPGVEYRDLHLLACRTLAVGLVDLGILRGQPDDLVERDVHALFFPHGVGHLLGLDVHDMEDLGDRAGYALGRQRSQRFGLGFLRLDRPLAPRMVVTIEPGFYQVPGILEPTRQSGQYDDAVNWERLEDFASVRGIRIEDDVLITEEGSDVLTAALPTTADTLETLVRG
ncbi:aminopeptidase P family protein [Phormidium sp. FACHB-1136]|uniref:aminopeptidase P family protein n=1 Tax=Phormidium sp. FACHB-1136 TaxID=2692848 RepID=UPI001682FCE6|nr:aminopeptidase P family protein [Phormidium sp. FACHB-1136]MBD2426564.1 aminopeptidase P family protein [Phormidium sp. FACHB-1136]